MKRYKRKLIFPYLLPALFLYIAFFLYPACRGIWISFHEWSGFKAPMKFVGMENFKDLLTDEIFWTSLKNMLLIFMGGGLFVFLIAFIISYAMSSGMRGKKWIRAIIFFPNIIAPVALAVIWNFIYSYDGLFNKALEAFGAKPLTWTGPEMGMYSILVATVWFSAGFYTVILLAGIDKISPSLYEAAKLEGASSLRIFINITIPLVWDVLSIAIVLWGISAIKTFEFIFALFNPEPPTRFYTIAIYQYIQGFGQRAAINQLGYSSAIAVMMIVVVAVLVLVMRKVLRREVYEM